MTPPRAAGPRLGLLLAALLLPAAARAADRPPNVVLILADDLGWADLGCYGNRFNETPRIDRLAAQGLRFTDFYAAAPVCSPTRAAIQSGRYQARFGLTAHIPGHWRPFEKLAEPPPALELPLEVITLAERLKSAGYATGYFGKWHLGGRGFGPHEQGYDTVFEFTGHVVPPARQDPPGRQPRRACEELAARTVRFLEANRDKPFFVQVSPFAVHIPLSTTPELKAKYEAKPKVPGYSCHPLYAGLLEELDACTGTILDALDRLKLSDTTLVIFSSDNGGLERESGGWPGTLNRPLRNEKGSLYEGGIRVPNIVRWPGVTRPGTVTHRPTISLDFDPTALEAAGVQPAPDQPPDGVSLLPLLRDPDADLKRDALYWHYPHYHHSRPSGAIRAGDWKAIEFFDTHAVELYNLKDDLGETKDLAAAQPEKVKELRDRLRAWRHEVNAQMPQRNPAYDPKRAGEWWKRTRVEPTAAPGTYRPGSRRFADAFRDASAKRREPDPTLETIMRRTLILAALLAVAAPLPAQPNRRGPQPKLTTAAVLTAEQVYKHTPQGELKLHFYRPPDWKPSDKRSAIVFFFGGGWRNGSHVQFRPQSEYFASRGLVCACADYRIESVHKTTPDVCIEDAKSAVRWLRQHAGEQGIDPDRLVAGGGSAGGHLAAAVAMVPGFDAPGDTAGVSCKPNALLLFNPALNVPNHAVKDANGQDVAAKFWPTPFLAKDAPPAIIFFGTNDRLLAGGREYCEKAKELGVRAELFTAAGPGHGFFNRPPWTQLTARAADRFLVSLGYLAGEPTVKTAADAPALKKEE